MTDGAPPPASADKSLGEIVGDVTDKASLLVREEIELAKAEVSEKIAKLGKGAAAGAAAAVFAVFSLIYALHALAWGLWELFSDYEGPWLGYLIVFGLLLLLGIIAGLLAMRLFKKGSPPKPDMAIEQAKRTRAEIDRARS